MSKNLLIVESPAKAKTIEKFLGKDFTVRSSYGHIRDLDKGDLGVDIKNDFKPHYLISPDKHRVVNELRELAKKADEVWLATDEDREGEAISWHLCEVLGLNPRVTKRIVFHEITKPAILKAIEKPRTVDLNLVDAQQARRVLDRLVGFELSGVLWKKIKGKLSAGRVQSVAVKLIVEKERDIKEFDSKPFYKVSAIFDVKNAQGKMVALKAELSENYEKEADANAFLKQCVPANYKINNIEIRPLKRKPAPPFTTSTLQQEASRKLGFSVNRTMSNAQKLYEEGYITYMRTDSTSMSETALSTIATEVKRSYGDEYSHTRQYTTKAKGAQEAHEAIRPTYIENKAVTQDRDQQRLYELIWKRTIASQMSEAQIEKTIVKIGISTIDKAQLVAEGEVIKFDGFLKVYLEGRDDEEDEDAKGMLPPLTVGQALDLNEMTATQRFTRPPARYTEASLVKAMEELGIGRPSTYAPTITKIMEEGRGYVVKETRDGVERKYTVATLKNGQITQRIDKEMTGAAKNHLFATDMGTLVVDFLNEHFENVMNYGFTAEVEAQFDHIADGTKIWSKMIGDFYHPFHDQVVMTAETAERVTGERILGTCPDSGRTVLIRMSRFGPVAQIGAPSELAEDEKPKYANLKAGQNMEDIDLIEALKLFGLPKTLGKYEDEEIIVGAGRYGPYVKYKETFISLAKGEDPMTVTLQRAADLIQEKLRADAPIAQFQGKAVTKGTGRFGPFIKWNDMFINIPVRYKVETINQEQCEELITTKLEKEANRFIQEWPTENIAIENGRWGPFIKLGKDNYKLKIEGKNATPEEAAAITLEAVKAMIKEQNPTAFDKKIVAKKAPAKKGAAVAKKAPAKKK